MERKIEMGGARDRHESDKGENHKGEDCIVRKGERKHNGVKCSKRPKVMQRVLL